MLLAESVLQRAGPRIQRAFVHEQCRRSYEAFCCAAHSMLYPGQVLNVRPYLSALMHRYSTTIKSTR
jgi:hypothetical protein